MIAENDTDKRKCLRTTSDAAELSIIQALHIQDSSPHAAPGATQLLHTEL